MSGAEICMTGTQQLIWPDSHVTGWVPVAVPCHTVNTVKQLGDLGLIGKNEYGIKQLWTLDQPRQSTEGES